MSHLVTIPVALESASCPHAAERPLQNPAYPRQQHHWWATGSSTYPHLRPPSTTRSYHRWRAFSQYSNRLPFFLRVAHSIHVINPRDNFRLLATNNPLSLSLSLTDCNQHVPSNLQVSIDFRFHLDSLLKGISFSLVSAFDGLRWNIRCFCCTLHSAPYVKSSNSIVKPAVLSIILQRK